MKSIRIEQSDLPENDSVPPWLVAPAGGGGGGHAGRLGVGRIVVSQTGARILIVDLKRGMGGGAKRLCDRARPFLPAT